MHNLRKIDNKLFISCFLLLACNRYIFTISAVGYFLSFIILLPIVFRLYTCYSANYKNIIDYSFTFLYLFIYILIGIKNYNGSIDIYRDLGAIFSLFLGYLVSRYYLLSTEPIDLLKNISFVGFLFSILTITAGILAFLSGESAYRWRGEYIPIFSNWLPFILVINYILYFLIENYNIYKVRNYLIFLAILISLSRADITISFLIFISSLFIFKSQKILNKISSILTIFVTITIILYFLSGLDVIQDRSYSIINYDEDSSLGWRVIENDSFAEFFYSLDFSNQLFGLGLGAVMPLLGGYLDFDGKENIPYLHNSYLTVILKFGFLGFFLMLFYFFKKLFYFLRIFRYNLDFPFMYIGFYFLLIIIAKAFTSQSLTDWPSLFFFGIGLGISSISKYIKVNLK